MIKELQRLESLLPQAEAVQKGADFKVAVERASTAVDAAKGLLDRLHQLRDVLAPARVFPSFQSGLVRDELATVVESGRTIKGASKTQDFHDAAHTLRSADLALSRAEEATGKAWSAEIQRVFGPLQQLGVTLSKIPESAAAGRTLAAWAQRTLSISQRRLPTAAEAQAYAMAAADVPARLKALSDLGIDEAVRRFLQVAALGQARLSDVEPGVLAWLRENGSASKFSVRLD